MRVFISCHLLLQSLTFFEISTGGPETCHGKHGTVLYLRGGGLIAREASIPTSGGTGSDSAQPSQSPVLSEGGGEEHAVQDVDHTVEG